MKKILILLPVFVAVLLITEVGNAAGWEWVSTGNGDCSGRDVRGLTVGSPKPDAALCNQSFSGKTAVCWDGTTMKHWGSDKPQCTYKDINPASCTGGGSPGYMYECRESWKYFWTQVKSGDCSGRDVQPLSVGSAAPKAELCNASFVGKTAVCWNGTTMKHWGSDTPQCTYKNIDPANCTGGGSPGFMYECVAR